MHGTFGNGVGGTDRHLPDDERRHRSCIGATIFQLGSTGRGPVMLVVTHHFWREALEP